MLAFHGAPEPRREGTLVLGQERVRVVGPVWSGGRTAFSRRALLHPGEDPARRLRYVRGMEIQALSDVLRADPRFETRRKWLILKDLYFTPTGEKVVEGFRYFRCSIDELVEPLLRQDFDATAKLPFALDDEGEVDTSSVLLNLAYTASGAIAGFQAVEYRDYQPVCVTEPVLLDGAAAQGLRDKLQELDQSS